MFGTSDNCCPSPRGEKRSRLCSNTYQDVPTQLIMNPCAKRHKPIANTQADWLNNQQHS